MGKIRPGNKQNSWLNGQWAAHCRDRRLTSRARRAIEKIILKKEKDEL